MRAVRTILQRNSRVIREKNDIEVITLCCVTIQRTDENSMFTLIAHRSGNSLLQVYK